MRKCAKFSPKFLKRRVKCSSPVTGIFLWKKFRILPGDVVFTSLVASIFSGAPVLMIAQFCISEAGTLPSLIGIAVMLSTFYIFYKWPRRYVKKIKHKDDAIADIIFYEYTNFHHVLKKSTDLFQLFLESLSKSQYGISGNFQDVLNQLSHFQPFHSSMQEISSPSHKLMDILKFVQILAQNPSSEISFEIKKDTEYKYREYSRSLETRMNIVFFVSVFFPVCVLFFKILTLGGPFWGFYAIFPVYWLFLGISYKFLFQERALLFLDQRVDTTKEMDLFIEFLKYFSRHLIHQNVDFSLISSIKQLHLSLKKKRVLLGLCNRLIMYQVSLDHFFGELAKFFCVPQSKSIFDLIRRVTRVDSKQAPTKIMLLIDYLTTQRNLIKEKISRVKSEELKASIFTVILPLVLGILGSVVSLFFGNNNFFEILTYHYIPLLWFVLIAVFYLSKSVNSRRVKWNMIWAGLFFSTLFFVIILALPGFSIF